MEQAKFEGWYIVEQMGHKRLSGYVQEATIAGHGFLRVDVYGMGQIKATQFIEPGTVYCLTPVTEEVARAVGEKLNPAPPVMLALSLRRTGLDYEDDDE